MSELSTEAGVPCHECTHAHVVFCCYFQCTIVNHEECLWIIIRCYLLNTAQNNYNADVKQSMSTNVQKIMPDHGKKKKRKRLRMWFSSRIRTAVQIVTGADVKWCDSSSLCLCQRSCLVWIQWCRKEMCIFIIVSGFVICLYYYSV